MKSHIIFIGLVVLLLFSPVWAETTCEYKDCKITITLKIAFSGATDDYIRNAKNEIESVWNGPNGQTFGDCKCPVGFVVQTTKTNDCKNNPPAGYHCITVTNYNNDPPRNQTNWTGATFYIGYMYGISTGNGGNSEKGWWSDIMSRPVDPNNPDGEHYLDFAHEAGHMMGLEDGDGGLMSVTSGPNAKVQQSHIDEIVNEICGANACPDRCCCGNGEIDRNKNEGCDPMATPVGCPADKYCCPGCCKCWGRICFPEDGEYDSESACEAGCGPGSKCYYNYQTGCWDCVVQVVVEDKIYDPTKILQLTDEGHTTRQGEINSIRNLFENGLLIFPSLKDFLANERADIIIEGGNNYHAITVDGEMEIVGGGALEEPTVKITMDTETLEEMDSGELHPLIAYKEGRLKVEGQGFIEGIKFWFAGLMVNWFVDVDTVGEWEGTEEAPVEEEPPGPEIKPVEGDVVPPGGEFPEGEIPEDVLVMEGGVYDE